MISLVELHRLFHEWRQRIKRVQAIMQPPVWTEEEWRQFAQALTLLLQQHGTAWVNGEVQYWDLRWQLREGGELICQAEQHGAERLSLVVAQTGGFAAEAQSGSYTWLWAEFGADGHFSRDPYWVDGSWKDALISLLLPYQYRSNFYIEAPAETPQNLLPGYTPPEERPPS